MSFLYPDLPKYLFDSSLTNVGGSSLKFRLKYSKKKLIISWLILACCLNLCRYNNCLTDVL